MSPRHVPLPDAVHRERHLTVVSVPGVPRGVVAFVLLLLAAGVGAVPVGLLIDAGAAADPGLRWAAVPCIAVAAVAVAWGVRQWRQPVPELVVSDIGVLGDATAGWSSDIRWDRVCGNPSGPVDVWVAMPSRSDEVLHYLHFFTSATDGGPAVARRLRLLVPATPGCLSYANAFALRRALLLQLATRARPPLRFDPMLFVQLGLHPRHWTPMPWPRRVRALLTFVPMGTLLALVFTRIDALPSVWWSIPLAVAAMVASVVFGLLAFARLYPALHGPPWVYAGAGSAQRPMDGRPGTRRRTPVRRAGGPPAR